MSEASHWCIVGPTHPFRGGIPRHTTLFADAAAGSDLDVDLVTYTRQYPEWLYKGESSRDPQQITPAAVTPEYRLDGIGPHTWWRTGRTIAARRPDVLIVIWWHPWFAPMVGTVLRQVRRRSPATLRIALCHNVFPHEGSRLDRRLVRYALTPLDGLVVHAASERDLANRLLADPPVLVTPHPTYTVDSARRQPTVPDERQPLTLLAFGIVRRYKGIDVLLRALPDVLRERSVRLIVAGEFWDPVAPYQDLIRDLGLEEHVELRASYVPEDELAELLGSADLMVAPYRSATQSGAVEMAFGAGLPVVGTSVGGLADQIDDTVNGLLVPPDDPGALSRALVDATDLATLARLTKGARSDGTLRPWTGLVDDIRGFAASLATGSTAQERSSKRRSAGRTRR